MHSRERELSYLTRTEPPRDSGFRNQLAGSSFKFYLPCNFLCYVYTQISSGWIVADTSLYSIIFTYMAPKNMLKQVASWAGKKLLGGMLFVAG